MLLGGLLSLSNYKFCIYYVFYGVEVIFDEAEREIAVPLWSVV